MLYILMILKPSYRYCVQKIWNFLIGFRVQHSGVHQEQFTRISNCLKLSQTFSNSYQICDIVNPSYCHLFNLSAISNLSYTRTAISFHLTAIEKTYLFHRKSLVNQSDTNWMDWKAIANLSEDFLRQQQCKSGSNRENILYIRYIS